MLRDVVCGAADCTCPYDRVSWMVTHVGGWCVWRVDTLGSEFTRRRLGDETCHAWAVGCPECRRRRLVRCFGTNAPCIPAVEVGGYGEFGSTNLTQSVGQGKGLLWVRYIATEQENRDSTSVKEVPACVCIRGWTGNAGGNEFKCQQWRTAGFCAGHGDLGLDGLCARGAGGDAVLSHVDLGGVQRGQGPLLRVGACSHRRMEGFHASGLGELGIVDGKSRKTADNTSTLICHAASVVDLGSTVIRLGDCPVGQGSPEWGSWGGSSVSTEAALSRPDYRPLAVVVGGLVGPLECLDGLGRDVPACPRHEGEGGHEIVVSSGFGCGEATLVSGSQYRAYRCDL